MAITNKQFEIEDDMRVLRRAEEVRSNPSRLKAAQQAAKKEVKELTKVVKGKR